MGKGLEISNATRRYQNTKGIGPVSINVQEGQICSFIGPNGSGKTTLLKCVSSLEKLDAGIIKLDKNYLNASKKDLSSPSSKNLVGMLLQNAEPWPHRNLLDNLVLLLILTKKMTKTEAKAKSLETLDLFGLSERAKSYSKDLSGGLNQRAAIARAYVLKPKVLILDEPTSALDPEWTDLLGKLITDYKKHNNIVLMANHQLNFIKKVSDKIAFLDDGHLVSEGNPSEIFDRKDNERLRLFLDNA